MLGRSCIFTAPQKLKKKKRLDALARRANKKQKSAEFLSKLVSQVLKDKEEVLKKKAKMEFQLNSDDKDKIEEEEKFDTEELAKQIQEM